MGVGHRVFLTRDQELITLHGHPWDTLPGTQQDTTEKM